jgi:uroporphyrinogen decarboxylase
MYYGYIDHPVKTRDDWARYRERYLGDAAARLPADLDAMASALNASPYPVGLEFFPLFFRGCFYLMGMERFLTAFYEAPDLVHAIFEDLARMALDVLRLVLPRVRLDFVSFAEDLAYKTGPHVSPRLYREFWLPYQGPMLEEIRRAGVPVVSLYTSGNIEALLPLLMEHGFNATWPLERGAGMDPVVLRQRHGRELRLGGGIPKEALVAGPAAIDREIDRLMPLIEEGGYLPAIDDMVPPEVPLAHYRHYIEAIRAIRLPGAAADDGRC